MVRSSALLFLVHATIMQPAVPLSLHLRASRALSPFAMSQLRSCNGSKHPAEAPEKLGSQQWLCACADDGLFQCQPPKSNSGSSNSDYAAVSVGGRRLMAGL